MFDLVNKTITLGILNWGEIVKGIVSIWVATVATLALKTWKRQSKAQKQTDFLDEITEAVMSLEGPVKIIFSFDGQNRET